MIFFVTHMYREGNHCVNQLTNIGLSLNTSFWWDHMPQQISEAFTKNILDLSYFRFCLFWRVLVVCPPSFLYLFDYL